MTESVAPMDALLHRTQSQAKEAYVGKNSIDRSMDRSMDALLTLSSKGQLVIPARLRQLLGLQAGDRLKLTLEQGLLLRRPQACATRSSDELIGCCGHQGPPIPLELQDPALQACELWNWVG